MSSRAEVQQWLDGRRPVPPPTLRRHLLSLVQDRPGNLADHLADEGASVLRRVLDQPEAGRELALDLLAADALVTYAFEAQAEVDTAGLQALARRVAGEDR